MNEGVSSFQKHNAFGMKFAFVRFRHEMDFVDLERSLDNIKIGGKNGRLYGGSFPMMTHRSNKGAPVTVCSAKVGGSDAGTEETIDSFVATTNLDNEATDILNQAFMRGYDMEEQQLKDNLEVIIFNKNGVVPLYNSVATAEGNDVARLSKSLVAGNTCSLESFVCTDEAALEVEELRSPSLDRHYTPLSGPTPIGPNC
ncbi:hypothetical protein RIF29_15883 [Crotalaria pallida]|uniref:Uncharacterized protein n=1 Tax=Crotalaria pallida TaxID=3830 RepID=A0AAN9FEB5_CROPI